VRADDVLGADDRFAQGRAEFGRAGLGVLGQCPLRGVEQNEPAVENVR
jgi:hypothetical protein